MFTTRIWKLGSLFALGAVVALALGSDDESKAAKYLMRSLKGDYGTNVVAMLQERSDQGGGDIVKFQRSKSGMVRQTVLVPLHHQSDVVNDGKTMRTYVVEKRIIYEQPVSSADQDFGFRWPLVQKNYTLKLEPGKPIAGRNCVIVTASARHEQMPDVRYFLDEKTGFPMSTETVSSDGHRATNYEVTDIKFPSRLDPSVFKIDPVVGVETISYAEPKCMSGPGEAAQALGFTPILPSKMPLGFQVQRMTISTKKSVKMLCLKLTDGIQRVTVFQWIPADGEKIVTGEDWTLRTRNGIKILVVSDIETGIRESIARTFLVRNDRDNQPMITSIGFSGNPEPL